MLYGRKEIGTIMSQTKVLNRNRQMFLVNYDTLISKNVLWVAIQAHSLDDLVVKMNVLIPEAVTVTGVVRFF